ncbi:MAG TPA: asparaginase, partial [Gemmatimonadales bacterium]|nr:asparaginase [Gemmatimonadales bacterium]
YVTFWRSAAKPFQAMPIVADGAADHFGITERELALTCASHSSEQAQVDEVREFLKKIGCTERDLMCGPHTPLSEAVAKDYQTRGLRLTAVYSNCSGKHTGMLAQAKHNGWPTEGYVRPEHPVQRRCLAEVSRWTGVPEKQIGVAVDGCGVACFALPIRNMAGAYARLGSRESGVVPSLAQRDSTSQRSERLPAPGSRVVDAMLRHPELIAGEGRPCTEMMRAHPNRVITKIGADGVYSALLVQEGLGVSLKIADGHGPASILAIVAILEELGLRPMPQALREKPMTNSRGETVGALRIRGGLTR